MDRILTALKAWFAPPNLGSSELNRRAILLHNILLRLFFAIPLLMVIILVLGDESGIPLFLTGLSLAVVVLCMALTRRSRLDLAGNLTVYYFWFALLGAVYTFDGIDGTAALGQILLIFLAGLLVNERIGLVLGLLTIVANYGAMLIQSGPGLPFEPAVSSLQTHWTVQGLYILVGMGLMQAAVRSTRQALSESLWNEQVLKDRVAELRQTQAELERNEQDMRRRESILRAVGAAAEQLFRGESLETGVPLMLEELGRATGADRVYIFENVRTDGGEVRTSQRFEWTAPGVTPQINNPELQNVDFYAAGFGRWMELLGRNAMVRGQVSEFPESERALLEPQGVTSILVVPIFGRDEWWGFMGFDEMKWAREWSPSEQEALRAAAGILGAAMERQRAEQALNRSEARYRAIVGDQIDLICRFDPTGNISFANDACKDYFGWTDEDLATKNIWETMTKENRDKLRRKLESLTPEAPAARSKSLNLNARGELRWQEWTDRGIFDRNGNLVEVQAVGRDVDEQERLRMEIEKQALTDSLTGLLNRRAIMNQLEMEWHRAKRDPKPLSLVMMDVDNLKDVNDEYGHLAGDEALTRIGELLQTGMRRYDVAGRWGGDEFLVVLPNTSLDGAVMVAQRVLKSMNGTKLVVGQGVAIGLEASLGVASERDFDGDGKAGVEALLARADEALYAAKQAGRNRVQDNA